MLYDEATDPEKEEGYPGFSSYTPCGKACSGGAPAWEVLAPELEFLGEILGRDFLAEARRRSAG